MSNLTPSEALQDLHESVHGTEVGFECTSSSCCRRWYVWLAEGERPRAEDFGCPARGCDGFGEVV
jgi:hypothetical protein